MNKKNLKTGFTLIELMAVISIITLFSSIVLVALNNVRDNARIAGSKQFSSHVIGQLGDNLISYWSFESASNLGKDFWGSNDGTLVNGPTQVDGVIGQALSFDGVDDYVSISTSASLDIDTNPVTMEAWVYPTSVSQSYREIIGRGVRGFNGYGLNLNTDKINLGYHGGGSLNSVATLNANQWYHVVGIINGASSKIYIDGKVDNTIGTVDIKASIYNATIGAFITAPPNTYGYYFPGFIDEVRIYNAALTAQEIQKHYVESAPRHNVVLK
jgi:prepilin-type N-terminal cleavage/methylation domain-containing protein